MKNTNTFDELGKRHADEWNSYGLSVQTKNGNLILPPAERRVLY